MDLDEEEEEEEASSENGLYGAKQALPVEPGEPDWQSGSPKTAEEYLKRVRWEAVRCPRTVVSDIDPRIYDGMRTNYAPSALVLPECSDKRKPTTKWMIDSVKDFQELRKVLKELAEDEEDELLVGVPIMIAPSARLPCPDLRESVLNLVANEEKPTVDIVLDLDQVEVCHLLCHQIDAVVSSKIRGSQENCTLKYVHALWIYALMARIQRPLNDETTSSLRSFLQHCAQERVSLPDSEVQSVLPLINILILLSGIFFGQDETHAGMIDVESD